MSTVNMHEAKSQLSRLVEAVESGREREIVIARNGHPAVKLVALTDAPRGQRLGVAKGAFTVPESIDGCNPEVEALFGGTGG